MFAAYLIVGNIFVAAIYIAGTGLAKVHIPAAADFTTSGQLEIQTRVDTRLQYSVVVDLLYLKPNPMLLLKKAVRFGTFFATDQPHSLPVYFCFSSIALVFGI